MSVSTHVIDFTGKASHTLRREDGVGNLYVGPKAQPKDVPQLVVDPEAKLRWKALESLPQPGAYPWPRWITYEGIDKALFVWAKQRRIERLRWVPTGDVSVNMTSACLHRLTVTLGHGTVELTLPKDLDILYLSGDLGQLSLAKPAKAGLSVHFDGCRVPGALAFIPELAKVTTLGVRTHRDPVDAAVVAQYRSLESLELSGAIDNLEALADLEKLETLTLRGCYDLGSLPDPKAWPHMKALYVFETSKADGSRIRREMKSVGGLDGRVSGLRTPEWIAANAGKPFSHWASRPAKIAREALERFKSTYRKGMKVADLDELVRAFVEPLNAYHLARGLETDQREDLMDAVFSAVQGKRHQARVLERFDAFREF